MLKSKVLAAVLAACVAGLPVLHGYADELSEKQAEYDRVQQQMRDMEAQREEARRAADAASSRMEEVVSELRQLQIRLDEINARQAELDAAIADNQAKLAEEKANLERRMNIFKKRLRDIYINGQINYLDVLLGAKDFSDFSSRMFLLQKIISRDIAMLDAINKSMAEIEKRQEELDAQTKELDALRAELEVKRQEAEARREERAQLYMLPKKNAARLKASTTALPLSAKTSPACCAACKMRAVCRAAEARANLSGRCRAKLRPTMAGVHILFSALPVTIPVMILPVTPVRLLPRQTAVRLYIPAGWAVMATA